VCFVAHPRADGEWWYSELMQAVAHVDLSRASLPCSILQELQGGFFIRAFECRSFNKRVGGAPFWNITALQEQMATSTFRNEFRFCAKEQVHGYPQPIATSFLRKDLPIKAYADGFGLMIRAAPSRVKCAYAFDSYQGHGYRRACPHARHKMVKRRAVIVAAGCRYYQQHPMGGVWSQWRNDEINCCYSNMGDATWAQAAFLKRKNLTRCQRGNGLNQMQLRWTMRDVFGVFYVKATHDTHARELHALATRMSNRSLQYCRLPKVSKSLILQANET